MKFFDTDWSCVFRWLAFWEKLSPQARSHYLLATPSHAQSVSGKGYGPELATVVEGGLVQETSPGRFKPSATSVPFRTLMAQLAKSPLFDKKPTHQLLEAYTRKHYVRDESDHVQNSWNQPVWDSVAWPKKFLAQRDVRKWEKSYLAHIEIYGEQPSRWGWSHQPASSPKVTWFADQETIEAAQCLVDAAMNSLAPLPLNSLSTLLPERLRQFLEPALKAALRYMLLYPALRQDTLDAIISLCPTVVQLRNRPPAQPPKPVPCPAPISPAFLMEDMTRLLAFAATSECRLNRGHYGRQLFKVIQDKLQHEFVALPPWLETHASFSQRLSNAIDCLICLKFAKDQNRSGGRRLLEATPQGRRWLADSPANRLRELLFEFKRHKSLREFYSCDCLELLPKQVRFAVKNSGDFDHLPWLESIWRQAAGKGSVPVCAFLDYHARASHPLANPAVPDVFRPQATFRYGSSRIVVRDENVEDIARELLELFFRTRLVPLGCVETGQSKDGELCFRLSDAGRFLFGLTKKLAYGKPDMDATVVVQPNFEIVFLHPSLSAEIDFASFAERCGRNVGTLFRLTRRQAIRAASQGITVDSVLGAFAEHSSKPVPENVATELRAWFAVCRTLTTRRAVLIEVGDCETALRVQKLLGTRCTKLTETLLEWHGTQIDPKLRQKLADQGVFIGS